MKARGLPHSNQLREFRISNKGINLVDVSVGPEGVLTGSARIAQEEIGKKREIVNDQFFELEKKKKLATLRKLQGEIEALKINLEYEEKSLETLDKNKKDLGKLDNLLSNRLKDFRA